MQTIISPHPPTTPTESEHKQLRPKVARRTNPLKGGMNTPLHWAEAVLARAYVLTESQTKTKSERVMIWLDIWPCTASNGHYYLVPQS